MRKQLFIITAFCAACLVTGAQAQSSSGGSSSGSSGYPSSSGSSSGSSSDTTGSSSGSSGGQSSWHSLSPTGRMSHHELRASQLTGAQVTSTSGSELGTISDVILNPASGRIDFAVISLTSSSSGGASSPGGSSSGGTSETGSSSSGSSTSGSSSMGSSGSSSASSSGKQVAVPWMLLRPSSTAGTSSTGTSQPTFTFAGDQTKLSSAPNFDPNTDLTQPGWRQSVFSYFGLSMPGAATGGSMSPGGSSSGTSGGSSSESSGSSSGSQQQ